MGQLALGFRSLLIKSAVFVVMAALLAWALGGTLWPRPQVAELQGVPFAAAQWHWQLAVGGARGEASWMRWTMMRSIEGEGPIPFDQQQWIETAGPIATTDALYYAGRLADHEMPWLLVQVDITGEVHSYPMPDRLAVEQQLARLGAGLPLQPLEIIEQQRGRVLDPDL